MSPSASGQDLDSSNTIIAENSCLRLRRIPAIRTSSCTRSAGGVRLHAGKASWAASTARTASSELPSGNRPMTCVFFAGLKDSKCFVAPASLPPMWFFPWIGSRDSTFLKASAKSRLFPSTVKSVSGSFRNSRSKRVLLRAEIYIRP